ncbi:MAG: Bax inhibitor-1/YccA family protein, partial [Micrococcales bacterium]|nr:Bax inhibitor-1/YccA family protein [Micrococcales bacterium]
MSNPVFNNSPVFGDPRRARVREGRQQLAASDPAWGAPAGYGAPGPQAGYAPGGYGAAPAGYGPPQGYGAPGAMNPAALESMYHAPSATNVQMRRMTYDDVIIKTGTLLTLLVLVAAGAYAIAPQAWPVLVWGGLIVGLVLG